MKFNEINELETKLNYKFDGLLEYIYFGEGIPIEGMKKAYEDGKIIELTVQTSTTMNENIDGFNPFFDILDGYKDDEIRVLARSLKEFGHPVLFRLNNEMNSDWTSYCISATMNDPELYRTVWTKFYDIFEEEKVNNAIWIFNPNDQSFPPCGYNTPAAFYPGNGYVHILGVTGYNTGTYYKKEFGETWKEFEEIYTKIDEDFRVYFNDFPWIITEFASSSVGGDKAAWVNNMFHYLKNDKRIKMLFWFNSADYDFSPGKNNAVSRPYWMDENEEIIEAFKNNFKNDRGYSYSDTTSK